MYSVICAVIVILRKKLQMKLVISSSHCILSPGQPASALTPEYQFLSLSHDCTWEKIHSKSRNRAQVCRLQVGWIIGCLTTRPTRQLVDNVIAWNSSRKRGFSRKWKSKIARKYIFCGNNRQAHFFSMKMKMMNV